MSAPPALEYGPALVTCFSWAARVVVGKGDTASLGPLSGALSCPECPGSSYPKPPARDTLWRDHRGMKRHPRNSQLWTGTFSYVTLSIFHSFHHLLSTFYRPRTIDGVGGKCYEATESPECQGEKWGRRQGGVLGLGSQLDGEGLTEATGVRRKIRSNLDTVCAHHLWTHKRS